MTACLTDELVAELVDGRLEGEGFERAEQHLAGCHRCSRLVGDAIDALTSTARPADREPGAPTPLARGAQVGRYEILEAVGAGAMGREKQQGKLGTPRDPRDVPPRVHRAVAAGLRPRPEDRPPSMDALLASQEATSRTRRGWLVAGGAALLLGAAATATG